jgi:uncharacterized membrane protein SirB2
VSTGHFRRTPGRAGRPEARHRKRRLGTPRVAGFLALAAALGLYYAFHQSLWSASTWWSIAFLAFVLIPAVFGLVYLALPLWRSPVRQLLLLAIAFGLVALVFEFAGASAPGDFAKLGAMTMVGWLFLRYFEEASWVVLVACIVPWVDAYSVWRGPTHEIVHHRQHVFSTLSFSFPVPGSNDAAKLGLPDLLFFALFLGAAARFELRVRWTWLCLTASIGATMALATLFDVGGLPALPLLSLGFLLPNADLLWRAVRTSRAARDRRPSPK